MSRSRQIGTRAGKFPLQQLLEQVTMVNVTRLAHLEGKIEPQVPLSELWDAEYSCTCLNHPCRRT